ncbi:MAG TPA: serine/threonine-protein kinase [Kofleriaceae bacterium]
MRRRQTGEIDPMSFGGRYTMIRRLAVGGMAEIYLARQAAMAGFEKEIVIKRLRQELADDPRIVEMFLDEAKIGAQLNHPNIVHVYDVDEHDGIPYIAMEYIIGEELNELCRRGIAHDRFLPIEHAVELIRQAAAGMGYFHSKRRSDGGVLDIVHLDISPSNLLVTQDGFLKIIDFGIARYKGQQARTDVLPGKLSYMSPEQAGRKPVDHRSDIFSLGIVLYEITVGKRLFRGPAQEVVERLIEATVEPPTFARRNFPPALESIVMRTLERHPEDRYQSAYDLADDLETFLRDEKLHSGEVRIARYLDMLSIAAGGARRPELISEAEARSEGGDELDFDSQVFDGFAPNEDAPGPEQAPLWEDIEQNDADIAAALHLELAELRALRTPVPVRPSGMQPVTGASALFPAEAADDGDEDTEGRVTSPVRKVTGEVEAQDGDADDSDAADEDELATTMQTAKPSSPPQPAAEPAPRATPVPREIKPQPSSPIGSGYLARHPVAPSSSKLPWLLVLMLGVAVLGLVAYIVMQ